MVTWKDYAIVAVKYKNEDSHILEVKVREYKEGKLVNGQVRTREEIVTAIENGKEFITAYWNGKAWEPGDDVGIVKVNNKKFIRTDGNSVEEDNLGDLPKFE